MEAVSFRDALGSELVLMGNKYPSMVVVTPDLANAVHITEFKKIFPERFISVGISEADCITVAAGLAAVGLIPVVAAFAMFAVEKPYEQIRNAIAYPCLNVKIFATHGGISVGRDGATHQATEDIAITRALPNFTVITAADASETRAAIRAALAHKGPVYLRLGRDIAESIYLQKKEFFVGKSDILRQGTDATIIACGLLVAEALHAQSILSKEGISVRVINMSSIKPLDEIAVYEAARETKAIVTAEDHNRIGGLGGAVAEYLVKKCPIPMEQVAVDDCFAESGSKEELFEKYGLNSRKIVTAVKKVLSRKAVDNF